MSKKSKEWIVVNEELHAQCRIFDVYKRHCRHPVDNKQGDFFCIKAKNWVLVLALTQKKELILIKQYRFGSSELSIEVPGGVVDGNESPVETAIRELAEETGYTGHNARIIGHCRPNPAILSNWAHFVLIEDCEKKLDTNWDHHEEIEISTHAIPEVYKLARTGQITHAIALTALFFLEPHVASEHP